VTPANGKVTHKNKDLAEASRPSRLSRSKIERAEKKAARFAYVFRLHNGEGGSTYVTEASPRVRIVGTVFCLDVMKAGGERC